MAILVDFFKVFFFECYRMLSNVIESFIKAFVLNFCHLNLKICFEFRISCFEFYTPENHSTTFDGLLWARTTKLLIIKNR
jgi:hypothetical protein